MFWLNRLYFHARPFLPLNLRLALRRRVVQKKLVACAKGWPIEPTAARKPPGWPGWPNGKQFAFVLTHDVEGVLGLRQTLALAELEESMGFRSSFNFVPEGAYRVPDQLRADLERRNFEVGVHDLHHDGKLYRSRAGFLKKAQRINDYLREWGAVGFRSAFMLHRLDWLHDLDVDYDASTFDTDPFEPQPDGVGTIFPFWVRAESGSPSNNGAPATHSRRNGYLELPYTLPQDSTLLLYLAQPDNDLWKEKLEWIAQNGGMALLNAHPDYMAFTSTGVGRRRYPVELYRSFLRHVREHYGDSAWYALPREVNAYIRSVCPQGGPRRPRHVCMLSYSFFERDNRVMRYAKALAARGDLVEVLSLAEEPSVDDTAAQSGGSAPASAPAGQNANSRTSARESRLPEGIRVHHLQSRRRNERRAADFLIRVLAFCWRAARRLRQIEIRHHLDLIHVHNVPDFIVFATLYPRLQGARIILDLHDLLPEFYQSKFKTGTSSPSYRLALLCERAACRFADHVIVSNHIWRDKVAARSARPEHCSAFVNHVDAELFRARRRTRDDQRVIAIFPGGLQYHQGVHVAIRAFGELAKSRPEVEFHVVGDGPERDELMKLASTLQLNGNIRFLPPVPLHEIPDLLANADLGVVPKLAEGFGNEAYSTKIMEFMAAGLPVVASRTRVDEYYFGDGRVHFFRSGDPQDMARAITEVLTDQQLRERLVAAGTDYVRRENWTRKSDEYLELVDRLLEDG